MVWGQGTTFTPVLPDFPPPPAFPTTSKDCYVLSVAV